MTDAAGEVCFKEEEGEGVKGRRVDGENITGKRKAAGGGVNVQSSDEDGFTGEKSCRLSTTQTKN